MRKQHITLTETDCTYLTELLSRGEHPAKLYRRGLALLGLDRGRSYTQVAETLSVSRTAVSTWATRYQAEGLLCLNDKFRSGRPIEIDGLSRAKITAWLVAYSQWSLRLLADKAVELAYCDSISHTQVATILKKRLKTSFEANLVSRHDR